MFAPNSRIAQQWADMELAADLLAARKSMEGFAVPSIEIELPTADDLDYLEEQSRQLPTL